MGSGPKCALDGPFPQATATLPLPLSPHSPSSFCNAPGEGGLDWCGGRGPRVQKGRGGGLSKAALQLGARPTSGGTQLVTMKQ